jgi:organic radical activating enzyme
LRVTGGEPLMHRSTWRLLQELEQNPKPHLNIEMNSNMGVKNSLVVKLVDKIKHLKETGCIRSFKLYTSIDTWGPRAEYTRTGLDIELWEKNLDYYLSNTGWPVTFMITFNLFAVTSFNLLLEKILEWRTKYNTDDNETQWQRVRFDTPYLKEPLQFDMNILPKDEFMPYMHKHLEYIKNNMDDADRTKFSSLEYERFRRVVDYMQNTIYDDEKLLKGRKNFYTWFTEYDNRRNTDIVEIFPELEQFYEECFRCLSL